MYIIVGGAGEVGYHVARALRMEGHDVAVIERDPVRLERLQELDVLAIEGNLANRSILEAANIEDADLLVACTGRDEINMVACALAKARGCRTIARLNDPEYLQTMYSSEYEDMGIDRAVSPEMVAAIRIKRLLNQPGLVNADVFMQGKLHVVEGRVTHDAFVVGKRVDEVEPPRGFNLFALYRGEDVLIPKGSTRFQAHDRLLMVVTNLSVMKEVENYLGRAKEITAGETIRRVMIAGSSRVAIHLARLLEQAKQDVVLVEKDAVRARQVGEQLQKALVVHGDVTQRSLLIQENVDTFDAFVAATGNEEYNVLAALMAKQQGVKLTVCLIHQPELKSFLETLDIDLAVAPRLSTVGAVMKQVHSVDEFALRNMGEEELLTFRVTERTPCVGKPIAKLNVPKDAIIAAIVRGEDVVLPRGSDRILPGDHVLAYALASSVTRLERLFK